MTTESLFFTTKLAPVRRSKRYSLFEKKGKKWVRISPCSFLKEMARHQFQDALLDAAYEGKRRELRAVLDR